MRPDRAFAGRPGARLVLCLMLGLWIGVAGAQEQAPQRNPEAQGEPVEEIEVTGRRSLLALQAEIVDAEIRMFNLFNDLNDVPEFDISCEAVMVTGSRVAERECVPVYMKRMRRNNVDNFLFSDITPPSASDTIRAAGGKSFDVKGGQDSEQLLWFRNQPKTRAFNVKFSELASAHPELAAAALDLQAKRQRLEELEERRRDESALGRFFAGFGKDED
jgi:hypothetical protein